MLVRAPARPPAAADAGLSALLSKLRRVLGPARVTGLDAVRLALGPLDVVDYDAAVEAVHRSESALLVGDLDAAYGPSQVAMHIAERGLLPGLEAPWIDDRRRELDDLLLRSLQGTAEWGLRAGGGGLATAARAARRLVDAAPYRESGYRLLIESLVAQGNVAEGLQVYVRCRRRFRDDLGAAPGPELQRLHARLLRAPARTS
jgi:DNA-binding SARP family transcriptional activator